MQSDKITLAFSPCPNDTFIFDAIVNKRIDWLGLDFDFIIEDVEYLNKSAFQGHFDISKLSFNAYAHLQHKYNLLQSGAALGNGCGPLLIAKQPIELNSLHSKTIAIPGINTTAFFLLKFAIGKNINFVEKHFSEIEDSVIKGEVDAGLIIHENRFTYQNKGLIKLIDLGEYWESKTGYPIPLGCIAVRSSFHQEIKDKVDSIIFQSIEYAFKYPNASTTFIKHHAQSLEDDIIQSHIDLYVNDFSRSLGPLGNSAVEYFLQVANEPISS